MKMSILLSALLLPALMANAGKIELNLTSPDGEQQVRFFQTTTEEGLTCGLSALHSKWYIMTIETIDLCVK